MKSLIPYFVFFGVFTSSWAIVISDTYYGGTLTLQDEPLLVTGAGVHEIRAYGLSTIEIQNTDPLQIGTGGIYTLALYDNSILNFAGGEMGDFIIRNNATAVFQGGQINYITSYQDAIIGEIAGQPVYDKHITVYCQPGWNYNSTTKVLSGLWANDDSFTIQLLNQTGYDSVWANIQIIEIPEPTTLVLFGLSSLLLRRKQK